MSDVCLVLIGQGEHANAIDANGETCQIDSSVIRNLAAQDARRVARKAYTKTLTDQSDITLRDFWRERERINQGVGQPRRSWVARFLRLFRKEA